MKKGISILYFLGLTLLSVAQGHYNYNSEGNKKLNERQYREAELIFKEGINKFPELTELYVGLSHSLIYQKKHTEADSFLDVLNEMDTANAGGRWFKGMNYYFWKKDSLSIAWFKKFIPLAKPGDKNQRIVHWYIGQSYFHMLKVKGLDYYGTEELLYHFKKFMRMQPDDPYNAEVQAILDKVVSQRPPGRHGVWKYKKPQPADKN